MRVGPALLAGIVAAAGLGAGAYWAGLFPDREPGRRADIPARDESSAREDSEESAHAGGDAAAESAEAPERIAVRPQTEPDTAASPQTPQASEADTRAKSAGDATAQEPPTASASEPSRSGVRAPDPETASAGVPERVAPSARARVLEDVQTEARERAEADETGSASASGAQTAGDAATGEMASPGDTAPARGDLERDRRPAFDVVRVEPGGAAVIAGRARPNSTVTVMADGEPIGTAETNAAGEFVVLPQQALELGRNELTLKALAPSGDTHRSGDAVVIATPPQTEPADQQATGADSDGDGGPASGDAPPRKPFALKVPRTGSGGAEVMQQPGGSPEKTSGDEPRLAFRVVQYTDRGGLVVSGVAAPDRRVVLRLDERKLGKARAAPGGGEWSVIYRGDIAPGLYTLKARALGAEGKVLARARTPFASQPSVRGLKDERLVVVQPGSNLWTIARRTYGEGVQYTTIYNANQDQIADPELIYPGQVFVLPDASGAGNG